MLKCLEPKYLTYLVIASVIAVVVLQVTGNVPLLKLSTHAVRMEEDFHDRRDRVQIVEPIAGHPRRWGNRSHWR